jgi:hypothetical protein
MLAGILDHVVRRLFLSRSRAPDGNLNPPVGTENILGLRFGDSRTPDGNFFPLFDLPLHSSYQAIRLRGILVSGFYLTLLALFYLTVAAENRSNAQSGDRGQEGGALA